MKETVKAWRALVTIPTYEVGKAEKNPMFLEKRVYQGSSGVVYPYPVIEAISNEKEDKEYLAVWLENEYIMFFPIGNLRSHFCIYLLVVFIQYDFHLYFTYFTIQSMQIGFSVTTSTKTFAGCISSRTKQSDI